MVTGLTDEASVKLFWPDVVDEVPPSNFSQQIAFYIQRAESLINRVGDFDTNIENAVVDLELVANMLVRRLVYADKHPSSSADPAGVRSETAHGISYSQGSQRNIRGIVGDEIYALLSRILNVASVVGMETQEVFAAPQLYFTDENGNKRLLFDARIDDNLEYTVSEKLGLRGDL